MHRPTSEQDGTGLESTALPQAGQKQRQGIIMAMGSCFLCYIGLFFHERV